MARRRWSDRNDGVWVPRHASDELLRLGECRRLMASLSAAERVEDLRRAIVAITFRVRDVSAQLSSTALALSLGAVELVADE